MTEPIRFIAYYLPQFHPIPENNSWWGNGFTEWTNVAKARPLYPGHYQPHIPADLGFYDLRVPETRLAQAEMARQYGIEGFCYWHYWFAGRRILERPFEEVLQSGEPDFPFCLGWANASWTGVWYGDKSRKLIEQTYPGVEDYQNHFNSILPALTDRRYITVHGMPLVIIFLPDDIPDSIQFTDTWREAAHKAGLPGLHLVGISYSCDWIPPQHGFDASILTNMLPILRLYARSSKSRIRRVLQNLRHRRGFHQLYRDILYRPLVVSYADAINKYKIEFSQGAPNYEYYPTTIPNWDNTPRSNIHGYVLENSTPKLFKIHLHNEIKHVLNREPENRVVFIKSWNEWAEGNHLEPDLRFGLGYLEVITQVLSEVSN
jgi:lipopolysaccharide biosynthesis protein